MNIYDFFFGPNINEEMKKVKKTENAVLLDVRTEGEYKEGCIAGSINLPMKDISRINSVVKNNDTSIFVYCMNGSDAKKAVKILKRFGYYNSKNIGGLQSYMGLMK